MSVNKHPQSAPNKSSVKENSSSSSGDHEVLFTRLGGDATNSKHNINIEYLIMLLDIDPADMEHSFGAMCLSIRQM